EAVDPFSIGKIRYLQRGSEIALISYGTLVRMAKEVATKLNAIGKSASVLSCHTIKPIDYEGVKEVLESHDVVIVLEEHVPHGGLGSRVKEIAWDIKAKCRLETFSLKDEFIHCYGTHDELLDAHGLSPNKIMDRIT
ncbi:MAG: transketolase, partial [Alphaproteobacteria bacterium]|nr:transketolase [Alphaproteobacteria bacterium]